jgi:hypothetical protein
LATPAWLGNFVTTATWKARLDAWLTAKGRDQHPFVSANHLAISRGLTHKESGLRMVVNIPAEALLAFVKDGEYGNVYAEPIIAGKKRTPSAARIKVDALLGFGEKAPNYFYGAAAMGGTGVRFYGEYCMVLKPDRVADDTQIFDRNSFDLLFPPLVSAPDLTKIVSTLRGKWSSDAVDMLALRVLPLLEGAERLITLGTVSDAVLHDEDFLELHKYESFNLNDLEEIRETPEDQAFHTHIVEYLDEGGLPMLEEFVWVARRIRVAEALRRLGLRTRVVSSSGRGSRWD